MKTYASLALVDFDGGVLEHEVVELSSENWKVASYVFKPLQNLIETHQDNPLEFQFPDTTDYYSLDAYNVALQDWNMELSIKFITHGE